MESPCECELELPDFISYVICRHPLLLFVCPISSSPFSLLINGLDSVDFFNLLASYFLCFCFANYFCWYFHLLSFNTPNFTSIKATDATLAFPNLFFVSKDVKRVLLSHLNEFRQAIICLHLEMLIMVYSEFIPFSLK